MKGLVMEIRGRHAIVLKTNGEFEKIKNNNFKVGYEVNLDQYNGFSKETVSNIGTLRKIVSIAAVFMIIFSLSYGVYSYNTPYSYVSVDINPSVEITANVFDRIINIEGINNDGEKLVSLKHYKNKKVRDGIGNIIESAVKEGYIKPEYSNMVLLTIASRDTEKSERIEKDIEEVVGKEINTSEIDSTIYIEKVETKKHDDAKNLGISPGKYLLIEKMKESEPEIKYEDWKEAPVREIMKSVINKKHNEIFENKMEKIREKQEEEQQKQQGKQEKEQRRQQEKQEEEKQKEMEKQEKEEKKRQQEIEKQKEKEQKEIEKQEKERKKEIEKLEKEKQKKEQLEKEKLEKEIRKQEKEMEKQEKKGKLEVKEEKENDENKKDKDKSGNNDVKKDKGNKDSLNSNKDIDGEIIDEEITYDEIETNKGNNTKEDNVKVDNGKNNNSKKNSKDKDKKGGNNQGNQGDQNNQGNQGDSGKDNSKSKNNSPKNKEK